MVNILVICWKKSGVKNIKMGKSLCTRLNFLKKIVMEFREEVGNFEKLMDFLKGKGKLKILLLSCYKILLFSNVIMVKNIFLCFFFKK